MTRVLTSFDEVRSHADDWDRLLSRTPAASGFEALGWLETCWRARPYDSGELHVLVTEREGRVAGILPLARRGGRLSFIGADVSNYSGPVLEPDHAADVTAEWLDVIASDTSVRSVDFANLREGGALLEAMRRWRPGRGGALRIVETSQCPEVDLSGGWDRILRRHGSGRRSSWRTKWRRFEALGHAVFEEVADPAAIESAMPDMFRLWEGRWAGRWTSAAFSPARRPFQVAAARSGVELLSAIRLDGRMVAFCLGVRANCVTTGYVMAHDDRFAPYSPGLLLLLKILEAAGARGDPSYDFSLGDMSYKSLWATGQRSVFRAVWGRGSSIAAARQRLWVSARSRDWLRDAKVEGPYRLRRRLSLHGREPNAPGLPLQEGERWAVLRTAGDGAGGGRVGSSAGPIVRRDTGFTEMSTRLSPRALRAGLDRTFHGDRLVVLSRDGREIGVAWHAADAWRERLREALPERTEFADCWYEPAPADGGSLDEVLGALAADDGTVVAVRPPVSAPPGFDRVDVTLAEVPAAAGGKESGGKESGGHESGRHGAAEDRGKDRLDRDRGGHA